MSHNTLFVHIGTHKTGSTVIQNTIESNRNLEKENIIFIGKYKPPIIQFSERGNVDKKIIEELKNKIHSDVLKYEGIAERKFIISNEKLAGDKKTGYKNAGDVAAILHELVGEVDWDIKIIVYFRRQDDFIESLYSQRIYNGLPYSFEEYLERFDESSFSWENIADSYAQYFGKENIIVRRYHQKYLPTLASIVHDFGNIVGSKVLQEYQGEVTYNEGYTNSALKVINLINSHLDEIRQSSIKKLIRKEEQKTTFAKYTLFNLKQRREILERYSESNTRVAKKYLNIQSGQLFPPLEEEYIQQPQEVVTLEDLAINFSLAFHHLYMETKSLKKKVNQLEQRKTLPERILRRIKRLFSRII